MIRINHVSVYANNPFACAEKLIAMLGGYATPFMPVPGGYMYYFGNGSEAFIEFYSKTHTIIRKGTRPDFASLQQPVNGAATHIHLQVDTALDEVAKKATGLGLVNGLRYSGFLDVWLEEDLLIEISGV